MDVIIKAENVTKQFKKQVVLDHVELQVEKGTVCGLVGANGSGKTVLLKVLCGFMLPDEGEIWIKGKKIGKDVDFPENTGVLIETPYFSPFSSGYQNLKNLAGIQKKIGPEQIRHAMELVGLDSADKKWVSKYSLGMRQRLGIAQALMEDQDLLILDEPMNGLDKQGVADIRDLILKMKQEGKTILMSSHYPQDMELLCDTIYEVDRGKIIRK
jgi:ABC-2 type transport system ATP-binding protein